ncbi:isochorismatase family protein [Escherichia coli]
MAGMTVCRGWRPGSPNFHKSNALKPCLSSRSCRGNWAKAPAIINWSMQLVRSLAILCCRSRATAVYQSPLDSILRRRGIRHLVFTGIATNVCVIDATRWLFSGVFGVVLENATHQAGRNFHRKPRCSISKPFLAGSATSKRSATRFLHILCSYR